MWIKASRLHPLVARETKRWRDLYRSRSAVEREFGRLKNEYAPLRVRGLERVTLHADLTMLARLSPGAQSSASRSAPRVSRFPTNKGLAPQAELCSPSLLVSCARRASADFGPSDRGSGNGASYNTLASLERVRG